MNVDVILESLMSVLRKERMLLLKAAFDSGVIDELEEIVKRKGQILDALSKFPPEAFEGFKDRLRDIFELNRRNEVLALSQLGFIEALVDAVFQNIRYTPAGACIENNCVVDKKI